MRKVPICRLLAVVLSMNAVVSGTGWCQPVPANGSLESAASTALDDHHDTTAALPCEKKSADYMVVKAPRAPKDTGIRQHTSVSFSSREIKTLAGAAGDISRYLGTLPSIVSSLGEKFDNTLYVRGGRPSEISFMVDGIEFENINHFSLANGSGGPIGFLNSDFIRSVRFYPGDIPVSYPDKISSIVDIDMKSGSFSNIKSNIGMKLTGGQASIEGPVFGRSGSIALAGRYIDFASLHTLIGDQGIPQLGDAYAKILFLPSKDFVVSATGLLSYNIYHYGYPVMEQGDDAAYFNNTRNLNLRILQGGAGISLHYRSASVDHQVHLGFSGRSSTSSDSLGTFPDSFFSSTYAKNPIVKEDDTRLHYTVHTSTSFSTGANQTVSVGMRLSETRYSFATADELKHEGTCTVCENDSPVTVEWTHEPAENAVRFYGAEAGLFAGHEYTLGPLQSSIGVRADYFQLLDDIAISPRISEMLSFGHAGALIGGAGLYHQFPTDLPTIIFNYLSAVTTTPDDSMRPAQLRLLRQAKPLRCWQGSIGYDAVPWDIVRSKCELYYKWYDQEYKFISPEIQDIIHTMPDGETAMQPQDGKRRAYGIELSFSNVQRSWLSYSGGMSVFDVKNKFGNSQWYNDWTNVAYTYSLSAGATLMNDHVFSVLLQGSGGRPFCPELMQDDCIGRRSASIDTSRAYFAQRLQRLFTVNVRYGFTRKILRVECESFLEVINLFNYKPVLEYKFNGTGFQEVRPFGITPIIGFNLHF